jgi:hypothetical protein
MYFQSNSYQGKNKPSSVNTKYRIMLTHDKRQPRPKLNLNKVSSSGTSCPDVRSSAQARMMKIFPIRFMLQAGHRRCQQSLQKPLVKKSELQPQGNSTPRGERNSLRTLALHCGIFQKQLSLGFLKRINRQC